MASQKYPYIRESRRIKAEFTILEQHVGTDARMQATGQKREEVSAMRFADTVGIGSYRIDLHPSTAGNNYIDVSSLPFQIPFKRIDSPPHGEPAPRLQEPWRDPHHQRLLSPPPRRMEHRAKAAGQFGSVLPAEQ